MDLHPRALLIAAGVALAASGCGHPSPFASGTGYGVGIPRTNFMVAKDTYGTGWSQGFERRVERVRDYRIKKPPLVSGRDRVPHWPPRTGSDQSTTR
jgi:hypothetical protein